MVRLSKRSERRKKAKHKNVAQNHKKTKHNTLDVKKQGAIASFFDKRYKILLIIPFLMLFLAIFQIAFQYSTTGDFINKGVSLSGGSSITIETSSLDQYDVENFLKEQFPSFDISVSSLTNTGQQVALIIETTAINSNDIDSIISSLENQFGDFEYAVEKIGSSLGEEFFAQTFKALIIAFILMGVVVFIYFKSFVPSFAVILSAFSDIVVTASIVNLMGIRLSTAGVAAFLMLIGYSVDTDILLSTKMLKGKSSLFSRFLEALKTGSTMTITTISAVVVAIIFTESLVIKQIMIIVLIGLIVDIINTWIQNAGLLRWSIEHKDSKKGGNSK